MSWRTTATRLGREVLTSCPDLRELLEPREDPGHEEKEPDLDGDYEAIAKKLGENAPFNGGGDRPHESSLGFCSSLRRRFASRRVACADGFVCFSLFFSAIVCFSLLFSAFLIFAAFWDEEANLLP